MEDDQKRGYTLLTHALQQQMVLKNLTLRNLLEKVLQSSF